MGSKENLKTAKRQKDEEGVLMNFEEAIEALEELKSCNPKYVEALDLSINTIKNIQKATRYNDLTE